MTNLTAPRMARPRLVVNGSAAVAAPLEAEQEQPFELPDIAPRIEIVTSRSQKRARPKLAYAAVVVTGVLAIVVAQLLLSVGLSDGAYEIASLQQQQKELDRTNQALTEQYDALSSPQNLAASAEALGMVTNSTPVYLRLSDGAVLGSPTAATGAAGTVTAGQPLIPNSLLTPPAVAPTTDAAAAAATSETPSAPPVPEQPADVPWQGALPSPTTH